MCRRSSRRGIHRVMHTGSQVRPVLRGLVASGALLTKLYAGLTPALLSRGPMVMLFLPLTDKEWCGRSVSRFYVRFFELHTTQIVHRRHTREKVRWSKALIAHGRRYVLYIFHSMQAAPATTGSACLPAANTPSRCPRLQHQWCQCQCA